MERCLWTSWRAPRPSKSTGVLLANFSFEHQVLSGLSANWFRVCLMLKLVCEHWVSFGHFCRLVLTCVWWWGPFARTGCYLGILPIGSDLCLPLVCDYEILSGCFCQLVLTCLPWGPFVLGKCLLGTPCWSLFWGICDSPVFWCVCIRSVWLAFSLPFVNWGIQFQFIKKSLPMQLWLRKRFKTNKWTKNIVWPAVLFTLQRKLVKIKLFLKF